MRNTLTTFVATVCLLALFIGSAACLDLPVVQAMTAFAASSMASHAIASDHDCCPAKSGSGMHTSISCCTVHHQSAIATAAASLDTSLDAGSAILPEIHLAGATVAPPYSGKTGPPITRPATKLRI
ncbi:MAG: hypothetical protein JST61_02780 [Acidobacteria bacterium]|nr:hypothetical protein [Acidobacteriota bacterium]